MTIEIRNYLPELADAIAALQRTYIAAEPRGTKFVDPEFYWNHPASERGRNVVCAYDGDVLVGYGALFPSPADPDSAPEIPNTIWTYIRFDPDQPVRDQVQKGLFDAIMTRATQYARLWEGRETRLAIGYPESRRDEIDFFHRQGLQPFDALLQMNRDLSVPLPRPPLPVGIVVRRRSLETAADKRRYVAAEARAFPHAPRTVDELDFYLGSWRGGTPITAFDPQDEIVGSVMAYWYGPRVGVTEDIFVLPPWRRRGIARHLIAAGIDYLIENRISFVWLEVKESNIPAVRLYESMGYLVANREEQLAITL
jgi:ribosomal protein S18 acetylase RimI-like enzyme